LCKRLGGSSAQRCPQMPRCQDAHPEFCAKVTWSHLAWDLIWTPILVLSFLMFLVMPVAHELWIRNGKSRLVRMARHLFGTTESEHQVEYPLVIISVFVTEMALSLWFASQWVWRSYVHETSESARHLDQVLCIFFLITYVINASRSQFNWTYALQPTALITLFTVVPTFLRPAMDSSDWFSFSYLRIANAVHAYEKLENTGALRDTSEMKRGYAITLLRTLVLVVVLSGTVFSLEVLGDPDVFRDNHVTTEMGDVSFIQMVYWIFTTISTVGYGDFSPTTTLSRLFIICAIIVGVYFFSTEVGNLVELHKLQSSGKGKWKPYSQGSAHVVVIGGGVRSSSSVLGSFLEEIFSACHDNPYRPLRGNRGWPNLSFMALVEQPSELREAIAALPGYARRRTKYFMGDPTRYADMERLRMGEASLVIIITDLNAADIDQEDTSNILRALAVKQSFPQVNLRLMLQRPANKAKAVRAGIWPSRCFSINELKGSMFALSCSVRGWSTMVTHCLVSEDLNVDGEEPQPPSDSEAWVHDFKQGRSFEVAGFVVGESYVGVEFLAFCREAATSGVMPIAVQISGSLVLNPQGHHLEAGEVIFGFKPAGHSLKLLEDATYDWRDTFLANQSHAASMYFPGSSMAFVTSGSTDPGARGGRKSGGRRRLTQADSGAGSLQFRMPGFMKRINTGSGSHVGARCGPVSSLRLPEDTQVQQTPSSPVGMSTSKSSAASSLAPAHGKAVTEEELERNARKYAEMGGHYLLVILSGTPWQQIQTILTTLRSKHNPFFVPIVVLAHARPTPEHLREIFGKTPRAGFLKLGSTPKMDDLIGGGLMNARCIMLYAGNAAEASAFDKRMLDGAGVTMLAAIEGVLCERPISSGTQIVLELHRQESVKFMHRFPLYEDNYADDLAATYNPNEGFTNHPRFASGGIFTASCLGALVARSHYTPGLVELMQALVLPQDETEQTSCPWQVSLPEGFGGRTYGELVQEFLAPAKGALCLGLFRKCFPGTASSAGYVVTNPRPTLRLREDDLVTVLGSASFGKMCFDSGMIDVSATFAIDEPDSHTTPRCDSEADILASALPPVVSVADASAPSRRPLGAQSGLAGLAAPVAPSAPVAPTASGSLFEEDEKVGRAPSEVDSQEALQRIGELERELAHARVLLADSAAREASLRAQLRACQYPLPVHAEAPLSHRSQAGAHRIDHQQRSSPRPGGGGGTSYCVDNVVRIG